MHRVRYLIVLVGLFVVTACGGLAPGETVPPTVPPVCISFAAVQARVADVQALDPETATSDEIESALVNLQSAWRQMEAAANEFPEEGYTELDDAMTALERSFAQLPAGTFPADALTLLDDEIQAVVAAATALSDELGCADLL